MSIKRLLTKGKVKEVYEIDEKKLELYFTNFISVFDKIIDSLILHKGEVLCMGTANSFGILNDEDIKTHFIKLIAPDRMLVRRFPVLHPEEINENACNYFIPLEVVCRWYAAGSLLGRIKEKKITAEQIGFSSDHKIKYGEKLPEPFVEFSTKLEKTDRYLTDEEAMNLSKLTPEELKKMKLLTIKIDKILQRKIEGKGLIHADGKKEFALDKNRDFVVVDTLWTLDEDRFWELDEYEKGNFVEQSKEFIRKYYDSIGYKKKLYEAREKGLEEPPIPSLPDDIIERTDGLYISMFNRLENCPFENALNAIKHQQIIPIIMGSKSDLEYCRTIGRYLDKFNVQYEYRVASAHKAPENLLKIIEEYDSLYKEVVYITVASLSNALSGMVAANTLNPVIASPFYKDTQSYLADVHSSLRLPSDVPSMFVDDAQNSALAAIEILALKDDYLKSLLKNRNEEMKQIEDKL